MPQACSQITILSAVFIESNTDAIAVKLNLDFFFFSEMYLQMCPLLAFPTVFDVIMVPHSKSSSFLLLSTIIYQAHWNEKHKTESSWCPWAGEKWNLVIWNSNCSCSWILQCHLVILFLSRELFCIYFGPWAQKPH